MRLTISLLLMLILVGVFQLKAQGQHLIPELESILSKAETYQKYKVIKIEDLVYFKRALNDSLYYNHKELNALEIKASLLQERIDLLTQKLSFAEQSLQESKATNEEITFLGLGIKKSAYHFFIWSLIALLSTFLVILYIRVRHACAVVKRVKEAYTRILEEYRVQRFAATEKQMKLKRELQTALNQIEVLREVEQSI